MKKNRYEFWWYKYVEAVAILPIAFALIPIPIISPYMLVQTKETPLIVFYFSWLILSVGFIFYMEKKYP